MGLCAWLPGAWRFEVSDSIQIKLRQRANNVLKLCELAESHRPETDKAHDA